MFLLNVLNINTYTKVTITVTGRTEYNKQNCFTSLIELASIVCLYNLYRTRTGY